MIVGGKICVGLSFIILLLPTLTVAIKPTYPKSSDKTPYDLSNMSSKTTREVEELIAFEKLYSPEEKATSNYNFTSMCQQLLQRPDVSASGILDCEDILNQTKAIP